MTESHRTRGVGSDAGVVWLNGLFGCGKTTTANAMMHMRRSAIFDPEEVGFMIRAFAAQHGETRDDFQHFASWRQLVVRTVRELAHEFGGWMLMPMTVGEPRYRREIRRGLQQNGLRLHEIYLDCPPELASARLHTRDGDGAPWAVRRNSELFDQMKDDVQATAITVVKRSPEELASAIWGIVAPALPTDLAEMET